VGHRYSPESLLDAQAADVEAAMWAAVRALEDRRRLLERMASQFRGRRQPGLAEAMHRRAAEAGNQARAVREALARAAATSLREVGEDDAMGLHEAGRAPREERSA
jgi:two-component system chemotaxis response regulator CheB